MAVEPVKLIVPVVPLAANGAETYDRNALVDDGVIVLSVVAPYFIVSAVPV